MHHKELLKVRILYLYSELMGYQVPVLREYVQTYGAQLHVVHWDQKRLTPYTPPKLNNVVYYNRSQYSARELVALAKDISPDIVYITAWQDRGYLPVARVMRKRGLPVVAGFDDQWKGSLRQRAASLAGPWVIKRYFSHAWVSGPYQYEYAKRLGFRKDEIIFHLLSCDSPLFSQGAAYLEEKRYNYPKTFLYVGNFRAVKGTDLLVDAFSRYRNKYHGRWTLVCVGNGEMKHLLDTAPGVEVMDFKAQEELLRISRRSGIFVLPSRFDQWGVVVHEFASAGMPLLLSKNVGSRATFLVDNFNGRSFEAGCAAALADAMYTMSNKSDAELVTMGENSHVLSRAISPATVAASFLSVLRREHANPSRI